MGEPSLTPLLEELRASVNDALRDDARRCGDGRMGDAIRQALDTPGKRLRPIATILAGEMLGAPRARLMNFAMAVEMVHTASLILDDLPSMDDSDLRRGRPTLHTQIGEADAILCAFSLLSRAFACAAEVPNPGRKDRDLSSQLSRLLEEAVGSLGMCEGQSLDLAFEAKARDAQSQTSLEELEAIHRQKTGALFAAALQGGALLAGAREEEQGALLIFGKNLGLAFQVADDLLDARGDAETLGKPAGTDHGRRVTFVSLFGEEASEKVLHELHRTAREALEPLGERAAPLLRFADYLEARDA